MKILLLCNKLPYPGNDGSSIAIAKMIEGYLEVGAEVSALCLNTVKHFKEPENIPEDIRLKVDFTIVNVDTNPTRRNAFANLFQKLPFHVSRFFQTDVANQLKELLANNTFDIIQLEGIFMMPYYRIIREHSKAKVVLRAHNVEHQIWKRAIPSAQPVLKAFLKNQTAKLKRYENWCATQVDAIIPISENDAEYFADFNQSSITIPCGIDDAKHIELIDNSKFFHLGAMDWLPNQQGIKWLLTEVWPLVYAQNNTLTLHLAGRAMSKELLQHKQEGVTVYGEIDDAFEFRKNHGIMLVPLLAASGIRIKIIEGLAQGLPIISTQIGAEGIPGINGKDIVLVSTAQSFADAILDLANNPEKCELIGKNAAILANENFNNKNLANKLLAFFKTEWKTS